MGLQMRSHGPVKVSQMPGRFVNMRNSLCSGFYAGTSAVVLGERISGHQGIFF